MTDYLVTIIPALVSLAAPILANTSSFLGFFDINKSNIKTCCDTLRCSIDDSEKKIIKAIIVQARSDAEVADSWLVDIAGLIDKVKKLELYFLKFNVFQRRYFAVIMNTIILSALLALGLIGASFLKNEFINSIVNHPGFQVSVYIYAAAVIMYVLLGGKILHAKKEKLESIYHGSLNSDADLPIQL